MNRTRALVQPRNGVFLVLVITVGALAARVFAEEAESRTPLNSSFTYQGRALLDGVPVNGSCDVRARLFDAEVAGTQSGTTQERLNVAVANGLFSVVLDFGTTAFTGERRFLETSLRCPAGSGLFVPMTDRQELTAIPYAMFAQSVPWSGITGKPPGAGGEWANVVIVAKEGGQFDDVQDALDSIAGASATNPYLVWVAPGVYDGEIDIPAFVTVRGAGPGVTILRSTGGTFDSGAAGVKMPAGTALHDLTVEVTGTAQTGAGILANGTLPAATSPSQTVTGVTVNCAVSGSCTGVRLSQAALEATDLHVLVATPAGVTATGGGTGILTNTSSLQLADFSVVVARTVIGLDAIGFYAQTGSTYTVRDGTISVTGESSGVGVIFGTGGENEMRHVSLSVTTESDTAIGVSSSSSGRFNLTDSQIVVDSQGTARGIVLSVGSIALTRTIIDVTSLGTEIAIQYSQTVQRNVLDGVIINLRQRADFGIRVVQGDTTNAWFEIRNSIINGQVGVSANNTSLFLVANTMLFSRTGGNFHCSGVYNENHVLYGQFC